MKFVAFSDTHDNVPAIRDLVDEIKKEKADLFIHAGDVISPFALREFSGIEELYLAFGNNDGDRQKLLEIALSNNWTAGEIVAVGGIAVYHGTLPAITDLLLKKHVIVITGHTHKAEIKKEKNSILINPGEGSGYLTGKRSYAVFEDGEISIIEF